MLRFMKQQRENFFFFINFERKERINLKRSLSTSEKTYFETLHFLKNSHYFLLNIHYYAYKVLLYTYFSNNIVIIIIFYVFKSRKL